MKRLFSRHYFEIHLFFKPNNPPSRAHAHAHGPRPTTRHGWHVHVSDRAIVEPPHSPRCVAATTWTGMRFPSKMPITAGICSRSSVERPQAHGAYESALGVDPGGGHWGVVG